MINQKQKAVVALLATVWCAAFASTDEWRPFKSSTGFFVSYPGAWVRNGVSIDRLQLLSSKGGAEGIGIRQDQAEITVIEAPESSKQTLAQVIAYYTLDTTVLSHKDIPGKRFHTAVATLKKLSTKNQLFLPQTPRSVCQQSSIQPSSVRLTDVRS